jgi:ferredoxin-thioredoxin reductase catalytic subunit
MNKEELRKYSNLYAEGVGYKLNPEKETVDRILDGLLKNEQKFGHRYCPCRVITGDKQQDSRIICPCEYHHREIEVLGHCVCNLYLRRNSSHSLDTRGPKMIDRRHYNWDIISGRHLLFVEHSSPNGLCSNCVKCGLCEVGLKARTGRTPFPEVFGASQFGAEKRLPDLHDLQIVPEIIGEEVFFKEVDTSVKIGGFNVSLPVSIAAIGSTKIGWDNRKELSAGAALAGIPSVIGENVYATHGEEGLKLAIKSFLDNYQGKGAIIVQANSEDQKSQVLEKAVSMGAQGIELKLGQGAKMGLGGEIKFKGKELAEKYKKMGYKIIDEGNDDYERHSAPGSIILEELKKNLVKYSDLKVPIWIKVAAGHGVIELLEFLSDTKKKENLRLEAVTIDGYGGGTGMSPWMIMNEVGVPSASVISKLKNLNFSVIVAGGYCDGSDIAKALMLGADAVSIGRPYLIAANVAQEKGVVNFTDAAKEELQMICACLRKKKLIYIQGMKDNLYPLSRNAADMFGLH